MHNIQHKQYTTTKFSFSKQTHKNRSDVRPLGKSASRIYWIKLPLRSLPEDGVLKHAQRVLAAQGMAYKCEVVFGTG